MKYLKGIDTLRAIAALVVVWGHLELLKRREGLANLLETDFSIPSGHLSVVLFFVISGFLITYLLVKEREKHGVISFKKFYLRRILRIWPLYYIVIGLSFLLFREVYSQKTIVLCLTIFPNIAHAYAAGWATSPQIWSIGVEEQFYLLWPLLFTIIPEKRIAISLILFFIGYSLLPHLIGFINVRTFQNDEVGEIINRFFYGTKFNSMAIGALVGFLYAKKNKYLVYFANNWVAWVSITAALIIWCGAFHLKHFTDELFSLLCVVSLYNIVVNPAINIDMRLSSFIGKISYGIYMYHWIVALLVLKYLPRYENVVIYNVILYILVFLITILTSWLSYNSIEKYFLRIKNRFAAN